MRQLRYIDFDCPSCGASCTRFVYFDTELERPCDDDPQYCREPLSEEVCAAEGEANGTVCDNWLVPREMSEFVGYMKTIAKGNSDFSERERKRLEKRADDHWRRQGRDEAIDRERAFLKKQGAVGGVR